MFSVLAVKCRVKNDRVVGFNVDLPLPVTVFGDHRSILLQPTFGLRGNICMLH